MEAEESRDTVFFGNICYDTHEFEEIDENSYSTLGGGVSNSVMAAKSVFPEEELGVISIGKERFLGDHLFEGVDREVLDREIPKMKFKDYELEERNISEKESVEIPERFRDAKVLSFGGAHPKHLEGIRKEFEGKIVFNTKDHYIKEDPESVEKAIGNSDIIVLNEEELEELDKEPSEITSKGKTLIVTKAEKGATAHTPEYEINVPSFETDIEKTRVGTGDAYKGVLSVSLSKGKNLEKAMAKASAAASFFAEDPIDRDINQEELDKRYEEVLEGVEKVDKGDNI